MPKFTFVLVVVALAVCVQGRPQLDSDVAAAAAAGNWAKVHEILRRNFAKSFGNHPFSEFSENDVRSLTPPAGGHVYAESKSTYQHSSNVNGHESHESGGHEIQNLDGKVKEWDIRP